MTTTLRMGFGERNKPLRGISIGSANNAGAVPGIGTLGASVAGFVFGRCHGVAWAVGMCLVGVETGVPNGLPEPRRSRRFILENLFFSDDNLDALLGAGDGDWSLLIKVLGGDITITTDPRHSWPGCPFDDSGNNSECRRMRTCPFS
jgi:hypothetical protein